MTMIRKILAVCIALALLCGIALAESVPADTVVLTVGEQQFTAQQLDSMAYMLYSEGVTETYPDYDQAVEYLTRQAVLEDYQRPLGGELRAQRRRQPSGVLHHGRPVSEGQGLYPVHG